MKYLLDTNAVIALVNRRSARLPDRIRAQMPAGIGVPVGVYHELFFGAFKSQRPTENLAVAGSPIGPYDLLIAAQARCRGLTLITANPAEFARIEGLRHENWLDP